MSQETLYLIIIGVLLIVAGICILMLIKSFRREKELSAEKGSETEEDDSSSDEDSVDKTVHEARAAEDKKVPGKDSGDTAASHIKVGPKSGVHGRKEDSEKEEPKEIKVLFKNEAEKNVWICPICDSENEPDVAVCQVCEAVKTKNDRSSRRT